MIDLNVFFAISALTKCRVSSVGSKIDDLIGVSLVAVVHPHNGTVCSEGLGLLGEVYSERRG